MRNINGFEKIWFAHQHLDAQILPLNYSCARSSPIWTQDIRPHRSASMQVSLTTRMYGSSKYHANTPVYRRRSFASRNSSNRSLRALENGKVSSYEADLHSRTGASASMPSRRALSLFDLLGLPGGAQALVPDNIASKLEGLGVLDYSSTISDGAYIHYGTIQALGDALPQLNEGWVVRAPGLTSGIPFQVTIKRTRPSASQNIEPAPLVYLIDLFIDRVEIELPFLRPARLVERSGVRIGRLVEATKPRPVRLVGSGTLRIRDRRERRERTFH